MSDAASCPRKLSRRRFLAESACLAGAVGLAACGLWQEEETKLGTATELCRWRVFEWNGDDFFVALDEGGRPFALNLTCTHKQCTVEFREEESRFVCPCHKGVYDRDGRVVSGKPPRSLQRYRIEERPDGYWLLNQPEQSPVS